MALLAMCMPILAGKKPMWLAMMNEINSTNAKPEVDAIREGAGVHERSFLQETPHGDFVILTIEGDDPAASWGKIIAAFPPEFAAFAKEVHGMDVNTPQPPLPTLMYDSKS